MSRNTKTRTRKTAAARKASTKTTAPTQATLPVRNPHTFEREVTTASATLYAGSLRIHAPHHTWTAQDNGTATTTLTDDTHLLYTHPHRLEATHPCTHGYWHTNRIGADTELPTLITACANCTTHAPAHRAQQLAAGIHRATASAEDTQTLDVTDLRADHDQAQPHPTETTPGYDIALAAAEAHGHAAAQHQETNQ
ncbi:hypothetical protein ACTOXX_34135 [Streptomyces rubiginosohelvolus]|uniref:hypothetical protein n=1 Tax=Streptomyces rubiginosohelvolus TaxID=67362 RepID=UPI003F931B54